MRNAWEEADHPLALWDMLNDNKHRKQYGPISSRKCRLLACARAELVRSRLGQRGVAALEYAYKYADDPATDGELEAHRGRWQTDTKGMFGDLNPCHIDAGLAAISGIQGALVKDTGEAKLFKAIFYDPRKPPLICNGFQLMGQDGKAVNHREVAAFFFGTTPCGPVKWRTPRVLEFAQQLYYDQDDLQYLALVDMMEEDGCDSPGIMNALRSPARVRGFWALDFILGKE